MILSSNFPILNIIFKVFCNPKRYFAIVLSFWRFARPPPFTQKGTKTVGENELRRSKFAVSPVRFSQILTAAPVLLFVCLHGAAARPKGCMALIHFGRGIFWRKPDVSSKSRLIPGALRLCHLTRRPGCRPAGPARAEPALVFGCRSSAASPPRPYSLLSLDPMAVKPPPGNRNTAAAEGTFYPAAAQGFRFIAGYCRALKRR